MESWLCGYDHQTQIAGSNPAGAAMYNIRRIDMKKWLKILLWSVGTLIVGLGIGYALLCYVINDLFKTIFGG